MRITAVREQKKHLCCLVLEDGTEVFLDRDTCLENALKPETELEEEQLEELRYDSEYRRAKSRALWYLDRGDRTEKGLYRKLVQAGFEERASAAVIARLIELEVIDDRRYAENFAVKCAAANISKRQAVSKMLEKGVPYDIAKEAADGMEADEEQQIRTLLETKYRGKLQAENGVQKVYAALARRGFSFGAIKSALKQYSEDLENSEEW